MTGRHALFGAVPRQVWAVVGGLAVLASMAVAVLIGAGLQVWRGGMGPLARPPATGALPPGSGVVVIPHPTGPGSPPAAPPTGSRPTAGRPERPAAGGPSAAATGAPSTQRARAVVRTPAVPPPFLSSGTGGSVGRPGEEGGNGWPGLHLGLLRASWHGCGRALGHSKPVGLEHGYALGHVKAHAAAGCGG